MEVHPRDLVVVLTGPHGKAEDEPTAGQVVDGRGLLRQQGGVLAERREQDVGGQTDPLGDRGGRCERDQWLVARSTRAGRSSPASRSRLGRRAAPSPRSRRGRSREPHSEVRSRYPPGDIRDDSVPLPWPRRRTGSCSTSRCVAVERDPGPLEVRAPILDEASSLPRPGFEARRRRTGRRHPRACPRSPPLHRAAARPKAVQSPCSRRSDPSIVESRKRAARAFGRAARYPPSERAGRRGCALGLDRSALTLEHQRRARHPTDTARWARPSAGRSARAGRECSSGPSRARSGRTAPRAPADRRSTCAAHVDQFGEERLEAGRRDDLEDPGRLVAAFQNVCHWLRGLKTRSPGPGVDHVVAEQRAHAPLEHVAVLVLARRAGAAGRRGRAGTSGARPARSRRRTRRRRS